MSPTFHKLPYHKLLLRKLTLPSVIVTLLLALPAGCDRPDGGAAPPKTVAATVDPVEPDVLPLKDVVREAYVYGFPMIAAYKAMYQLNVDRESSQYKGPFNHVLAAAQVFTPKDTAIVTPNSDTPYGMLQADLRAEPLVLSVPDVEKERYYSVQFSDMYACNYGYVGSRATGNAAGRYLLAGPGWQGETPAGIDKVFHSATEFSLVIYRTQLFGPDDVENVRRVQAGYLVQPLSAYLGQPALPAPPLPDFPKFSEEAFKTDFPRILNFLLAFCPAAPEEKELRARMATVGIAAGKPFDPATLSIEQRVEWAIGVKEAYDAIERQRDDIGRPINGWRIGSAFGDRAFYHGNYLLRAAAALAGIYGNDAVEAMYPMTRSDGQGERLDGSQHNYTLTFAAGELPPVNAFWSVTMYDGKTQLLVENPIHRYLINSPMLPGLKTAADGSLTLYIQKDAPAAEHAANWLPAPDGPIYLVMRLYWPKTSPPSILPPGEGTWAPPPVVRTD